MGESRKSTIRLQFDGSVRLTFHGATITADAGLLVYRELNNALGLTDIAEHCLHDNRHGKNTRHSLGAQLRQSVFSRLAGYEDTNDAELPRGCGVCQSEHLLNRPVGRPPKAPVILYHDFTYQAVDWMHSRRVIG
jgi:hypothetical protein